MDTLHGEANHKGDGGEQGAVGEEAAGVQLGPAHVPNPSLRGYFECDVTSSGSFFDNLTNESTADEGNESHLENGIPTIENTNTDECSDNSTQIKANFNHLNDEPDIGGLTLSSENNGLLLTPPHEQSDSAVRNGLAIEVSPQICTFFNAADNGLVTDGLGLLPLNSFDNVIADGADPFESVIRKSESDRRRDAWVPTARTLQTLNAVKVAAPGTFFPDKDQLTMPGVVLAAEQGDPIRDFVLERIGPEAASQRLTLTCEQVAQDELGLKKLVDSKCYRAALNLTNRLLAQSGQGPGKLGHPSTHTPNSLQIWFLRISLLMKLGLFAAALAESEPFGDAAQPDLFYEFYPDTYGKRKGSMVPFTFRIILGEVLLYNNKFKEALDHLCNVLAVVRQILQNLGDGLCEDGTPCELTDRSRTESADLWRNREKSVMYAILNSTVVQQDYHSAVRMLTVLREKDGESSSCLWSAQGRILLQLGDVKAAQNCFGNAAAIRGNSEVVADRVAALVDRSVMCICQNNFAEAYGFLMQARQLDPKDALVLNNCAVCLLYMCKMRDALKLLEEAIESDTQTFLQECVVFNVCTLYELESSNSVQKKLRILGIVNRQLGDGFNVSYLKIPPKEDRK